MSLPIETGPSTVPLCSPSLCSTTQGDAAGGFGGDTAPQQRHAHLVGCCGAGMRGLAGLLQDRGWTLSGTDQTGPSPGMSRLIRNGLHFFPGHAQEHFPPHSEVLIHSQAIDATNPERVAARKLCIPERTYSQMLGELMRGRSGVCIAGTHGKSTTTAMTACLLTEAGRQPSAIFGAELCESRLSSWAGSSDLFVVESCEYRRSFLDLEPKYAAITGIEPDHFDCFADLSAVEDAFAQFARRIDPEGFLLVRHEDISARTAAAACRAPVITFGWTPEAEWWAADIRRTAWGSRFRLFRRGQYVTELEVPVPGRHNVMNALVAAALGSELGVAPRELRSGILAFPGIARRFEHLGSWRGVTVIDDYAHHPSAVAATLHTARELYGSRKIRVAFQPHQLSRTRQLLEEFGKCFHLADEVFLAPIFTARETSGPDSEELLAELSSRIQSTGIPTQTARSLDHLESVLEDALQPGDVLMTLGAGDIDRIHHAFTRRLHGDYAAGRTAGPPHLVEGRRTRPVFSYSA